jgi:hypothetical protein
MRERFMRAYERTRDRPLRSLSELVDSPLLSKLGNSIGIDGRLLLSVIGLAAPNLPELEALREAGVQAAMSWAHDEAARFVRERQSGGPPSGVRLHVVRDDDPLEWTCGACGAGDFEEHAKGCANDPAQMDPR